MCFFDNLSYFIVNIYCPRGSDGLYCFCQPLVAYLIAWSEVKVVCFLCVSARMILRQYSTASLNVVSVLSNSSLCVCMSERRQSVSHVR